MPLYLFLPLRRRTYSSLCLHANMSASDTDVTKKRPFVMRENVSEMVPLIIERQRASRGKPTLNLLFDFQGPSWFERVTVLMRRNEDFGIRTPLTSKPLSLAPPSPHLLLVRPRLSSPSFSPILAYKSSQRWLLHRHSLSSSISSLQLAPAFDGGYPIDYVSRPYFLSYRPFSCRNGRKVC